MNLIKAYAVWIAAAAIAAALMGAYFWIHHDGVVEGEHRIQVKLDKLIKETDDAKVKLVADNAEKTRKIQEVSDERERKSKEAFGVLMDHADALAVSVRNRPNRPTGTGSMPAPASACTGATGAQLARGDGEFLIRYAADAARAQIAIEQCQAAYNAARALINGASP